jgi:cell division protein FtsI (penicillin-binding protein 3)
MKRRGGRKRRSTRTCGSFAGVRGRRPPPLGEEGFQWGRVRVVLGLLGVAFLGLVGRTAQMHVLDQEDYLKAAEENVGGHMVIQRRRADISDRRGEALAATLRAKTLVAEPVKVKHPERAAVLLAPHVPQTAPELLSILDSDRSFSFVAHQVSEQTATRIEELLTGEDTRKYLVGLRLMRDFKRYYPKREVAAQILGWAGVDNRGVTGLEHGLDRGFAEWIHGRRKRIDALRTGRGDKKPGRRLAVLEEVLPLLRDGAPTVYTTLDIRLQSHAEQIIFEVVRRAFARRGLAIVLDVKTGQILAFAHVPRIDPNTWLAADKEHRIPWGLREVFEPGSVMKVFTVAAALDRGLVTPWTVLDTHGGRITIGERTISDLKRMKEATLTDVMRYSSNIGAYEVAKVLGQEALEAFLRKAGFGKRTGLPLPYEAAGIFRRPATGWDQVKFANVSFGQGIAVTAVQLVSAFAAFGNDGLLLRPQLIKKVVAEGGKVLYQSEPEVLGRLVRSETATSVRRLLAAVVEPGATGQLARLDDCPTGGKTGTGQQYVEDPETGEKGYSSAAEVASFAGLVPIDDPAVAIYVMVDRPAGGLGGGSAAAPAFARIAEATLDLLGRRPCSRPVLARARFERTAPRPADGQASWRPLPPPAPTPIPNTIVVPDLEGRGLAEAIEVLVGRRLSPDVRGAGVVQAQEPPGGALVSEGATIQLQCSLGAERVDAAR